MRSGPLKADPQTLRAASADVHYQTIDGSIVRFPLNGATDFLTTRGRVSVGRPLQEERYIRAAAKFGAASKRLARAYEIDPERRRDLLQDIRIALWQHGAV